MKFPCWKGHLESMMWTLLPYWMAFKYWWYVEGTTLCLCIQGLLINQWYEVWVSMNEFVGWSHGLYSQVEVNEIKSKRCVISESWHSDVSPKIMPWGTASRVDRGMIFMKGPGQPSRALVRLLRYWMSRKWPTMNDACNPPMFVVEDHGIISENLWKFSLHMDSFKRGLSPLTDQLA